MTARWLLLLLSLSGLATVDGAEPKFSWELHGLPDEGTPLAWADNKVSLLNRAGTLVEFDPQTARSFRPAVDPFVPFTIADLQTSLRKSFTPRFEISGAKRYVVVHPASQPDVWPQRMDELHRLIAHYFNSRGYRLQEPRFPMTAVVLTSADEYHHWAWKEDFKQVAGLKGFYSLKSNRLYLCIPTTDEPPADWTADAETIVRAAAVQTAYNTGVFTRFVETPRWIVEGLGCQFEVRNAWNPRQPTQVSERLHATKLNFFRNTLARRKPTALSDFLSSDRAFEGNPEYGYAEAWALTFYLSEADPRRWVEYLKLIAKRKPLEPYPGPERLRDFTAIYGADLQAIDARLVHFAKHAK